MRNEIYMGSAYSCSRRVRVNAMCKLEELLLSPAPHLDVHVRVIFV